MKEILILYFSKYGATELLAREIANGVDSVEGVSSKIRTVPSIPISNEKNDNIPDQGPPYIEKQDLFDCDGLILGSPCRFGKGHRPTKLKYFRSVNPPSTCSPPRGLGRSRIRTEV